MKFSEMYKKADQIFNTVPAEQHKTLKRRSKPILDKYTQSDILEGWCESKRNKNKEPNNFKYWYGIECILIYALIENPWEDKAIYKEFIFS